MSQDAIAWKFKTLKQDMDERLQRLWVAAEAEALGWGGVSIAAKATGMSRTTIAAGQSELSERRGSIPSSILRGARSKAAITQTRLSELTGIPQRHISEMEQAKRVIGKETAKRLAVALNLDYRILL